MPKKVFADILNSCDIYRMFFIVHMANLLNNGMVMDMGNVFFLLFNIYILSMQLFCLHFWMGKYKTATVIAELLS